MKVFEMFDFSQGSELDPLWLALGASDPIAGFKGHINF